jgi:hypothetical protein
MPKSATCSPQSLLKECCQSLYALKFSLLRSYTPFPDARRRHVAILDIAAADADSRSKECRSTCCAARLSHLNHLLPPINSYLARHLTTWAGHERGLDSVLEYSGRKQIGFQGYVFLTSALALKAGDAGNPQTTVGWQLLLVLEA